MHIQFNKLKFKNILSYGGKFVELDFNSGLNLIKAENGSRKIYNFGCVSIRFVWKTIQKHQIRPTCQSF